MVYQLNLNGGTNRRSKFVVDTETIAYLHFELHAAQVALQAESTSSPHQFLQLMSGS